MVTTMFYHFLAPEGGPTLHTKIPNSKGKIPNLTLCHVMVRLGQVMLSQVGSFVQNIMVWVGM